MLRFLPLGVMASFVWLAGQPPRAPVDAAAIWRCGMLAGMTLIGLPDEMMARMRSRVDVRDEQIAYCHDQGQAIGILESQNVTLDSWPKLEDVH
jgi:hypothetical protein